MNFENARHNMIEQQIRPWDVLDQTVLDLLAQLPREDYVPEAYRNLAFTDMSIPLDSGQLMMPPRLEARILQALDIKRHETILEIGTGSGFFTAMLATLGLHVYSVEYYQALSQTAGIKLAQHDIANVTLSVGDAANGWNAQAPYDVIVLTGSTPVLPDVFQTHLNVGGRLFAIIGDSPVMEATLITRIGEHEFQSEAILETDIAPLINAPQPERFSF